MRTDLGLDLHLLTARLDQAADKILRRETGTPYRRYLTLFMVGELGATSQRSHAKHLGLTEPSVSRMTGVLERLGLLRVKADLGGGNRKQLALTDEGVALVERCEKELSGRLSNLLEASGVPLHEYETYTARILATLETGATVAPQPLGDTAARTRVPA